MNNTFSAYIAAFDELNILTSTSYYSASGKDMTSKVAQIADDILSLLIRAYQQGITATADMLAYDLTLVKTFCATTTEKNKTYLWPKRQ